MDASRLLADLSQELRKLLDEWVLISQNPNATQRDFLRVKEKIRFIKVLLANISQDSGVK